MRRLLFAAVAVLPLALGASAASADSIQNAIGGSMYQPQKLLPNAVANAAPDFVAPRSVEGRAAFVDPQAYYNAFADPEPASQNLAPVLTGRDWRPGDNF